MFTLGVTEGRPEGQSKRKLYNYCFIAFKLARTGPSGKQNNGGALQSVQVQDEINLW